MFVLRSPRKISRDLTGKSPSLNSIRLLSTMTSKASSSFLPSLRLNQLLFLSRTDVEQYISVPPSPSLLPLSSMQKRLIAPPSSVSLLLLFLLRLCDGSDGDGGVRDVSPADADPLPPSCVRVCVCVRSASFLPCSSNKNADVGKEGLPGAFLFI